MSSCSSAPRCLILSSFFTHILSQPFHVVRKVARIRSEGKSVLQISSVKWNLLNSITVMLKHKKKALLTLNIFDSGSPKIFVLFGPNWDFPGLNLSDGITKPFVDQ